MLESLATSMSAHSGVIALIGVLSFLLLTLSLLATPWILAKLPTDYFTTVPATGQRSVKRLLMSVMKTVLGIMLILTGFLMMVTPGPGLVCLVMGMALCELPGKHRLLQQLVRRPSVFSTLNWLREKANEPPFLLPPERH